MARGNEKQGWSLANINGWRGTGVMEEAKDGLMTAVRFWLRMRSCCFVMAAGNSTVCFFFGKVEDNDSQFGTKCKKLIRFPSDLNLSK